MGRKRYEELARSKRSSGAPFVTLPIKGVFCKEEGDAEFKEGVKKETPLIGNLNFKLAEYLTESALYSPWPTTEIRAYEKFISAII